MNYQRSYLSTGMERTINYLGQCEFFDYQKASVSCMSKHTSCADFLGKKQSSNITAIATIFRLHSVTVHSWSWLNQRKVRYSIMMGSHQEISGLHSRLNCWKKIFQEDNGKTTSTLLPRKIYRSTHKAWLFHISQLAYMQLFHQNQEIQRGFQNNWHL